MPPHQIFARLARRARGRWLYPLLGERLFPPPSPLPACLHNPTGAKIAPPALSTEELRSAADELAAHRFTYLNLPTADLGSPVDWQHSPEGNRLWGYQLHYGHWALTLAHAARAAPDATTRYREALIGLLRDWIEHNLVGRAPAWDPDPIARRLVTWSKLPCLLGGDATWDAFWRTALEPSLRRQARCLAANLEHDVPNNHLIGNYRALAWVGLLFEHWP
ncbi:MAG: heparinase II/III family protein, partial [Acidobacteriota bacterium]